MGMDKGSSSGFGACYASATGKRRQGIEVAVDWIKRYPGIDAFSVAWLEAGGKFDPSTGQLTGATHNLDMDAFARVLKVTSRVQEALDRGLVVKVARCVSRPVQSSGLALPGVIVKRVVLAPNELPSKQVIAKASSAKQDTPSVSAPMPKGLKDLLGEG